MKIKAVITIFLIGLLSGINIPAAYAQSRQQRGDEKKSDGKKNKRPTQAEIEAQKKKEEEQRKLEEEERNAIVDDEVLKIDTQVVNVDAVVYNKKNGNIITGLKKENFAVFENGVKQEISEFATPESPITVTMIVEFSRWTEALGGAQTYGMESGKFEVVRPAAYFLANFIKPPNDYASLIAFDIRPTPITDFTNDPNQLREAVNILVKNQPAFSENNLFDSIKLALVGGKADSVVLENSKQKTAEYGGMISVKSRRRAIILVASGINTRSNINYGQVRKIIQNAGIPIYIISTGNYFYKRFESELPPEDSISGAPGRLTFLQAKVTMDTFAKESGGKHFPVTFEGEVPSVIQSINALLRNQYSIAYDLIGKREPGKKYKLEVRVDVNGDGVYDDKQYVVQHRPFFVTPKADEETEK